MKKKIKAFTLIELLVVVSIITIISGFTINGVFNFFKNNSIKNQISEIIYKIEYFDNKIKNYEIFDYEITFKTNTNKYLIYENIFNENKNQKIDNNGITAQGLDSETWIINLYKNEKLFLVDESNNDGYSINFDEGYDYKVIGSFSGTTNITKINNIKLINFDLNNKDLIIKKISETKNGPDLSEVKIKNIGGRKNFYDSSDNIINSDEIYLHFESHGNENYLIIKK